MWRFAPWLLAVLLAPVLFGSVNADGQAVVGVLLGLGVLLLANRLAPVPGRFSLNLWSGLVCAAILVHFLPLPVSFIHWISPENARLLEQFPVTIGEPASWATLTVSPAAAVQRLLELLMVLAGLLMARQSMRDVRLLPWVVRVLAVGVLFEVAADIWYRQHGQQSILGLWTISWGKGAGTFANRNHFAGWIGVATLVLLGVLLRAFRPLRGSRPTSASPVPWSRFDVGLSLVAVVAGVAMLVASASRGGALAWACGVVAWGVFLAFRSRSRTRWLLICGAGLLFLLVMLPLTDQLFRRLTVIYSELATRHSKFDIWRDTLRMIWQFPLFGVGPGSFATAFNHFKTFAGDATFLHAENDWLQWLAEYGLIGGIAAAGWLLVFVRKFFSAAWDQSVSLEEPELFLGVAAGLVAFGAHMMVEFVGHILANALLAGVLVGLLLGLRDRTRLSAVPLLPSRRRLIAHLSFAALLMVGAGLLGASQMYWRQALAQKTGSNMEQARAEVWRSQELWPWDSRRPIADARLTALLLASDHSTGRPAQIAATQQRLTAALERNPFHWELRLERAWFDLAFSTNRPAALEEARQTVRLNPLQPAIPLRFAQQLAVIDPDAAWSFLEMVPLSTAASMRSSLLVAWQLRRDPATLWYFVTDTVTGMDVLGEFALQQHLRPLAVQAYLRLASHRALTSSQMASRFLSVDRPDLALQTLPSQPRTVEECLWTARAEKAQGMVLSVLHTLDRAVELYPEAGSLKTGQAASSSVTELRRAWEQNPKDSVHALALAESLFNRPAPARDLATLRELARTFPTELRLQWMVVQTHNDRDEFDVAAGEALTLLESMARRH